MPHDPAASAGDLIRLSEHLDLDSATSDATNGTNKDVASTRAGDALAIPSSSPTASLSTPTASTGELIATARRQRDRARHAVRVARTRLPPAWQHPGTARQAGRQLAEQVVTAPFRYPRAVARGAAVTGRTMVVLGSRQRLLRGRQGRGQAGRPLR